MTNMKQMISVLYWIDIKLFPTLQNCQEYYNGCCFQILYHFNMNVSYTLIVYIVVKKFKLLTLKEERERNRQIQPKFKFQNICYIFIMKTVFFDTRKGKRRGHSVKVHPLGVILLFQTQDGFSECFSFRNIWVLLTFED